jgi:anti-sigma B factor antagonist
VALKLSVKNVNGVTVVYCSGRIVFGEEAADLRERVKEMLATIRQVVLNLGGVSYIDSGGLGTLVGLYTSARAAGGEIKLANLTQRVRDQLQITKLVTVFEVFESEEKAVESFAQRASA